MTRRRWIAEHWDEATATITGAQAEHMSRVLRAQPGMEADIVAEHAAHVFGLCPGDAATSSTRKWLPSRPVRSAST